MSSLRPAASGSSITAEQCFKVPRAPANLSNNAPAPESVSSSSLELFNYSPKHSPRLTAVPETPATIPRFVPKPTNINTLNSTQSTESNSITPQQIRKHTVTSPEQSLDSSLRFKIPANALNSQNRKANPLGRVCCGCFAPD